ncbi:MAG: site-specific integrase [Acidimicrobiales bacterium]
MRGSVVKKGDRYYVKIELDADPATGRRRQKWHSGYRTKREAERARVDLLSKFDRGEYVEPSQQTLAEFLEEWLRAIEPTVRPSTFDSYSRNMRNHVIAHIGSVRLTKVDAGTLNGLYAHLLASGRRRPSRTGRGYSSDVVERALELRATGLTLSATAERLRDERAEANHITKDTLACLLRRHASATGGVSVDARLDPRTVNYVHTIAHRAFKDAVRWGRLARNPADAADPPRGGQKSDGVHSWDAATLRGFLAGSSTSGDRLHPLWVLLATTGMRRGEALGLRWSDVDLDTARLRVVQTIIQVGTKVTIGEPKTARGRRPIALDAGTVAVLREHRRRSVEERVMVGPAFEDQGLVFRHPDGSCLKPDAVSAAFARRMRAACLPRLTLKGLRHTWATLALERAIHPRVVQERLGHSTIAITLGIYSHVAPTLHDEAAQLVADLVLDA